MKTIIIFALLTFTLTAQTYKAVEVKGDVKYRSETSEKWNDLKPGSSIGIDEVISTGNNSSVKLQMRDLNFSLEENSALQVGNIKKMSMDELLLALAMEDMINVPLDNKKGTSDNTATYGTHENGKEVSSKINDDFGIKRLNGAMQLANSGLEESALLVAKETYRKYPGTKNISSYLIFFAYIFYSKGLYEEALNEFNQVKKLKLSSSEATKVETAIEEINKLLLNN